MPEVRPFDLASIQASIDRALAALPPEAHGAVVAHGDLAGGITLAVAGRIGDRWTFVGRLSHTLQPGAELSAEAEVRFVW